jgi:hypothetical protein
MQIGRKAEKAVGVQVMGEADFAAMVWLPATMTKTMTPGYVLADRPESAPTSKVDVGGSIDVPATFKVK